MIAAAIVAIGVLVTVHEFGHYIVARWMGIKVLRFSVGFGKPLWKHVAGRDKTEYVIAGIPLGGYVKMLDEREGPVPEADRGRAFNQKPVWRRVLVLVAGPAFNFFFAVFAFWAVFLTGVPQPKATVGAVEADSVAAIAGLREGDEIIVADGQPVATWGDAHLAMLEDMIGDGRIEISVRNARGSQRDITMEIGEERTALTEPGALLAGIGIRPWQPERPALIGAVSPGDPAERAGILPGDLIVAVDGTQIPNWQTLTKELAARPGDRVRIEFLRDSVPQAVTLKLGRRQVEDRQVGLLGVTVAMPDDPAELWGDQLVLQRHGVIAGFGKAAVETYDKSLLMLRMFGKMLTGDVSLKNISGPINIAQYAGYTASDGPVYYLRFLALLSLSLGILNLLPIPMLDGGQLVYQLAEAVKGSPVSMRTELIGQQVGILLLILLMSLAFYNDFARLAG